MVLFDLGVSLRRNMLTTQFLLALAIMYLAQLNDLFPHIECLCLFCLFFISKYKVLYVKKGHVVRHHPRTAYIHGGRVEREVEIQWERRQGHSKVVLKDKQVVNPRGKALLAQIREFVEDYSRHRLTAVPRCQSSLGWLCVSRASWVCVALLESTRSGDKNQWFVNSSYSQQLLLTTEWSARNPIANSHIWDDVWGKKYKSKLCTNNRFDSDISVQQLLCGLWIQKPFRSLVSESAPCWVSALCSDQNIFILDV